MDYSLIFKFCPGPGIIFSDILRQTRYGESGIFVISIGQNWEAWSRRSDEVKMNKFGLLFFSNKRKYLKYKRDIEQLIPGMNLTLKNIAETDLTTLTDSDLLKLFVKTTGTIKKYINQYFYTEFFCFDLIEAEINRIFESKYSGDLLQKNLTITLTPSSQFFPCEKIGDHPGYLYDRQQEIFEEMDLCHKDRHLIEVVKEMQEIKYDLRVFLNQFFFGEGSTIFQFIREIGKRYNIARNQVNLLTIAEIKKVLSGKGMIDTREIFARQKNYFISSKSLSSGRSAKILVDQIKPKSPGDVKKISGSVANHGIARGKAKIIRLTTDSALTSREVDKMEIGQILVADTTGPELIIACRKAVAIVADEGGINSHAAITSRELNIPCVVGTKIATDVVKDGDMLEVNADSGIVTIL